MCRIGNSFYGNQAYSLRKKEERAFNYWTATPTRKFSSFSQLSSTHDQCMQSTSIHTFHLYVVAHLPSPISYPHMIDSCIQKSKTKKKSKIFAVVGIIRIGKGLNFGYTDCATTTQFCVSSQLLMTDDHNITVTHTTAHGCQSALKKKGSLIAFDVWFE